MEFREQVCSTAIYRALGRRRKNRFVKWIYLKLEYFDNQYPYLLGPIYFIDDDDFDESHRKLSSGSRTSGRYVDGVNEC